MATGGKLQWWQTGPRYAEWIIARAVLLDKGARAAFVAKGYPPGMFRCPIARGIVVWALSNRRSLPAKLAVDAVTNHDGYQSFAEFMKMDTVPEEGDGDFGGPPDPGWIAVRYQREMREWAHGLHEVYRGKQ